jgi:hypothetical protein
MLGNLGLGHCEVVHDRPDGLFTRDEDIQNLAPARFCNGVKDIGRCGGAGHA